MCIFFSYMVSDDQSSSLRYSVGVVLTRLIPNNSQDLDCNIYHKHIVKINFSQADSLTVFFTCKKKVGNQLCIMHLFLQLVKIDA